MRRYRGRFRPSEALTPIQFSAVYTITMFGFDLRQGQAIGGAIDRLRLLDLGEWRRLYQREPPRISRDLLVIRLGYRLQEIAHGGLSKASRRKLQQWPRPCG